MEEEPHTKVKDYMSTRVITVKPDQTLEEIMKLMSDTDHDGFPVLDGDNIVGFLTTRDLVLKKKGKVVKDIMTRKVVVTFPDTTITDASRVMFRRGLSRLPVVDENKKLIGIVTNTDVIRSHIERVTPAKVIKIKETMEQLYSVRTVVRLASVKISELIPTQNKVRPDEFRGREYEIKRGLAEPIVVVKSGERMILVDGHHRVLAAWEMGLEVIDAYIIVLNKDIELGLEKTAKAMGLQSIKDIKVVEDSERGIAEVIGG